VTPLLPLAPIQADSSTAVPPAADEQGKKRKGRKADSPRERKAKPPKEPKEPKEGDDDLEDQEDHKRRKKKNIKVKRLLLNDALSRPDSMDGACRYIIFRVASLFLARVRARSCPLYAHDTHSLISFP
jgi:hypothetical protein